MKYEKACRWTFFVINGRYAIKTYVCRKEAIMNKDLPKEQVRDVVVFLHSLTEKIPEDVLTIPVLPSLQ